MEKFEGRRSRGVRITRERSVSKMSHHMEKEVKWGIFTRDLRIVAAFAPVFRGLISLDLRLHRRPA